MTGISPQIRDLIFIRDDSRCQWCGTHIDRTYADYSIQHRRARGMGGSSLADTDLPANLVLLCGSATTKCHGHVESHRSESIGRGFTLWQSKDPKVAPGAVPLLVATLGLQRWETHDDNGGREILRTEQALEYMRSIGAVTS